MSRNSVLRLFAVFALGLVLASAFAAAQSKQQLRFCLHSDPKTFNPLLAEEDSSETIRYLTGGVLMRLNRLTQDLEPELATAWRVSDGGKTITFKLRSGLSFSDGTPFTADDVAYTIQQMMEPNLHSPTGDAFRSGDGKVQMIVAVTPDLTAKIKAGQIVKEIAPIVGGGGGGRPDFAEAGGRHPEKIDEMLAAAEPVVARLLQA